MFWYLLNILILTIVWLLPINIRQVQLRGSTFARDNDERQRKKRLCIIGTLNWILLSGLRSWSIGDDTLVYGEAFERVQSTSWTTIFNNIYLKYFQNQEIKDPGYALLEKVFQIFSNNYQVFLIFIAIVFFVGMGIFIYKYSRNPYVSFVLFSCLFYSFFAITGHRQTIATAIVVWGGFECIKKRKLIPFVLLILLMSTIHASVICFLPFYWISKIKINKYTLAAYWVAIVFAFVFRNQLLSFLQFLAGYEQYQSYEGAGAGTFMFLLLLIGAITSFFHKLLLQNSGEEISISINALLCACFFSSLLLINQSTMRVVQYYSLFLLIMVPELSKIFKEKKEKMIYNFLCVSMMVLLLILNRPEYVFFWQ